jgi:hypothetical protein
MAEPLPFINKGGSWKNSCLAFFDKLELLAFRDNWYVIEKLSMTKVLKMMVLTHKVPFS